MNRDRALELKVGIFVAIGLAMICGFVVRFGRLGEGIKAYYNLTIRFKDASGLLKGSDVLFSGAKIGRVGGGPRLVSEGDRKSTRLNSSHRCISYAVFCL